MRIAIICAAAKNKVIGQNNIIPWNDPNDLVRFKNIIEDGILIMGRKTYESLPNKKLPGRLHIVVTRIPDLINSTVVDEEVIAVSSFGEAIATAKLYLAVQRNSAEIFRKTHVYVIGGADIIKAAIPIAAIWFFTYVDVVVKDDPTNVTVDPPDPNIWRQASPEFETMFQTKKRVNCEVESVMKVYVKK